MDKKMSEKNGVSSYNYVVCLFTIVIQSLIIYYLHNLEDVSCNCVRDWRHNYIKYFAVFAIINSILNLYFNKKYKFLTMIIFIFSLINIYAFYTYIGELNNTNCACAVDKQPRLNYLMKIIRITQIILLFLGLLIGVFLIYNASKIIKHTSNNKKTS